MQVSETAVLPLSYRRTQEGWEGCCGHELVAEKNAHTSVRIPPMIAVMTELDPYNQDSYHSTRRRSMTSI